MQIKMKKNKETISINNILGIVPPQCTDVEKTLIAQLLIDGDIMSKTSVILRPEMFYNDSYQKIYTAINELFENGIGINMITVIDKLRKLSLLELVGGAYFITSLTNEISTSTNHIYHAQIIHQTWLQRFILNKAYELQVLVNQTNNDVEESKIFIDELKNTVDFEVSSKSNNYYEETIIRHDEYISDSCTFLAIKLQDRIVNLMSENAMSMIYGTRGARKSTLMSLLVGYISSGKIDSSFVSNQRKVKIFDTEQSPKYSQKTLHKIIGVSGLEHSDFITYHTLKKYNKNVKKQIVEMCIAKDKPSVVILDNIRHFVSNINDFTESGQTLEWLLYIQAKYNVHICCVIHQNKGDNNARGHLGAEIDTATEMTLRINKDPDNKMQSIITFEKTRDGWEPDDEILQVDENNIPSLIRGLSNEDAKILFDTPIKNKFNDDNPF